MTKFREGQIFWNDKFSGMTKFQEWQIFVYDEFLGGIFLTFNLLPIASFRIGVPSILFIFKAQIISSQQIEHLWWLETNEIFVAFN